MAQEEDKSQEEKQKKFCLLLRLSSVLAVKEAAPVEEANPVEKGAPVEEADPVEEAVPVVEAANRLSRKEVTMIDLIIVDCLAFPI